MYIPFEENIGLFALVGLGFVGLFLWWFRGAWKWFFDPFFVNVSMVGLSTAFVASIFFVPAFETFLLGLGVLAFVYPLAKGAGKLNLVLRQTPSFQPGPRTDQLLFVILMGAGVVLALDFWINIRPAMGSGEDMGGSRYLMGANNRLLSIAGYAARPIPLIFLWLVRPAWMKAICVALIAYEPFFGLILGSKSVLLYLPLKIGAIIYFRYAFLDSRGNTAKGVLAQTFRRYRIYFLGALAALMAAMVILTPLYVAKSLSLEGYRLGFSTISQRFLLGFDSALMAIQIGMKFPSPGLNLFELWFASPLKMLGLFHGYWDAINQYIGIQFMMLSDNARMQFPNNFMVLEVFGSIGWIVGLPLIAGLAYGLGRWIRHAARRRATLSWAYWFGFLTINPFQFLIDGQSFVNMLLLGVLCWIPIFLLEPKPMRRRRPRIPLLKPSRPANEPAPTLPHRRPQLRPR